MYRLPACTPDETLTQLREERAALERDREVLRRMQSPRRRAVVLMAVATAVSVVVAAISALGYGSTRGALVRAEEELSRTRHAQWACSDQLRVDHAVAARMSTENEQLHAWCGSRVLATSP
jgi:hypothetical protein